MGILQEIQQTAAKALKQLYNIDATDEQLALSPTRKEFEGDYTLVVFPFTKAARKKPTDIGDEVGRFLLENSENVAGFNVIQGFLNITTNNEYWKKHIYKILKNNNFGQKTKNGQKVMVEYASPNTNKPLHLGHIRNILLGESTANILEAEGYEVLRTQIVNDRGIAVCKSMLAWQHFGEGKTPQSTGIKGDHFVGDYYVLFEKEFQKEYKTWQQSETGQTAFTTWISVEKNRARAEKQLEEAKKSKEDDDLTLEKIFFKEYKNTYFNQQSALGAAAKKMLIKWEQGDPDTIELWQQMNAWVYEGFNLTYQKLGATFDCIYYESDTYLLGKDVIDTGLQQGIFYQKEDGSVWIDLEDAGLDQKLVLRSDGTSVYITQDIGTAMVRHQNHAFDKMAYVVADEQNYHFQALFETLKKMGEPYANGLHHLSYGMVNLPEGRMKSREGTVVDADDLIDEVVGEVREGSKEMGTLDTLPKADQAVIFEQIGLAAIKFFILKVNPQRSMVFDPKESVDLQGQTGPYIQYSCVRINSVLEKAQREGIDLNTTGYEGLLPLEKDLLMQLHAYPAVLAEAAETYNPAVVANYAYNLAKTYHRFWNEVPILRAESEAAKAFRLRLGEAVGKVLAAALGLLGIEVPKRM